MRRLLALLGLALLGAEAPPLHGDPVVLELPGMADVAVRTLTWGTSGQLFLYLPPAAKERAPVVVFAIGYSDDEAQRRFGAPLHRYRQYDSWARLAAVSGFAGVTYATQSPERALAQVVDALRKAPADWGIDASRVGLWSASRNARVAQKYALRNAAELRFAVFYYPLLDPPDAVPKPVPILVVKAEGDQEQGVNAGIQRFARKAAADGADLKLIELPGQHAFDVRDSSAAAQDAIKATLRFMRRAAGLEPES